MKSLCYKQLAEHVVDYRKFRFNKLNTPYFSHLWYLLYWPIYGILFAFVERGWTERDWVYIHCGLDDMIPFCEFFVIPYMYWFVFLIGMLAFALFFDSRAFKRMMVFVIITYSLTILTYLLFPSAQNLRPDTFARDNLFTRFLTNFYAFDTNTNICPSLHVIGAVTVLFGSWDSWAFQSKGWKIFFWISTILISVSTVFLKQHSILDVFAGGAVCLLGYFLTYRMDVLRKCFGRKKQNIATCAEQTPENEEDKELIKK